MKSLYWLSIPFLLAGLQNAHADFNYPDFSEKPISIGRVLIYPSVKGIQWMTPTAFNVDFDCSNSEQNAVCGLQIFNSLDADERSQIRMLSPNLKNIIAFRDIDLVMNGPVTSEFSDLSDAFSTSTPTYLNNLTMGTNALQASVLTRVKASEADHLKSLFQTSGLGTFSVRYRITGEEVYQYLKLNRPDCLKDLLADTTTYKVTTLRAKIKAIVSSCDLSSKGLEPDEVKIEATDAILRTFYQSNHYGRYTSKGISLLKSSPWIIMDETSEPIHRSCVASVSLNSSATVHLDCEDGQ